MISKIEKNVLISRLSTFQNSGEVPTVYHVHDVKDLSHLVKTLPSFFVLGKGSNTLINPEASNSNYLKISPELTPVECEGDVLFVSAGVSVHQLMQYQQDFSLGGLEFSAGVPASIGGMVAMNFGCWGEEISQWIDWVEGIDREGNAFRLKADELGFRYRGSRVLDEQWIVTRVALRLRPVDPAALKQLIQQNVAERIAKQPLKEKTFGSVFKNPEGHFAAQLIESVGFKGKEVDGVKLSEQHANFMVNCGSGTFDAALSLIERVTAKVLDETGVQLEREVRLTP